LTASNQEKLQPLLQDRYLEDKVKIPNYSGKLKTCPEINKAFSKSLAEVRRATNLQKTKTHKYQAGKTQ